MCVCVNTAQSAGDNKEFVVGLECPERLELWQLQRSEFTDVALSCQCCLRTHCGSIASAHSQVVSGVMSACLCVCVAVLSKRHPNPRWSKFTVAAVVADTS